MKIIQVYMRSTYGNARIYIDQSTGEGITVARQIRALTSRETLLPADIKTLEEMGYEFKQVADPKTAQLFVR